jgi:hypothetical protein
MNIITESDRETHTGPMFMWQQAKDFLLAARKLGDGLPATFLGCHGIELALKSYLRAHGMKIAELQRINHSLLRGLNQCVQRGMDEPPSDVWRVFDRANQVHVAEEHRYGHTYHPRLIATHYLLSAGRWSLGAAATAVAEVEQTPATDPAPLLSRMRKEAAALLDP